MAETPQTRALDSQLFVDVFNASPIGIAVENLEGRPLFVNPALRLMLGFSEEELHRKHCVDFSPPEEAEKDWALFQQLRAGSIDHYQLEKRYFRRDGSLIWGRLSISLLDSRPSPLVIAMVEDITDKKRAEEALFRHAAIVESSEDAIASVTLDGVIASWNAGAQRIFGYTEIEAVGQSVTILVPPERSDEESKILETLKAGGRLDQFETVRVTKTGKRINVSVSISPIKDSTGKTVGCSGIARDITERKRAEEALLEVNRTLEAQAAVLQSREELLKIFVKNVPAGVAMFDREMRYLEVSERWCTTYSVDGSQILGRSHYDVFPDLPERYKEIHRRGLAGETIRADEDRWDREGGTAWARWEVRPWKTPEGDVGGILIFVEDITRRKQMEETLSTVNQKLIQAHEQERTLIARELHDDINQRLAMLSVKLSTLKKELACNAAGQRVDEVRALVTNLGNDVQALSHRLHSSKLEYLGLESAAAGFCQEFAEQKEVEIDFHSTGLPRDLSYESSLCLFRVLQEALQNAAKHSGSSHFHVILCRTADDIHLTVSDSGAGFDAKKAQEGRGLGITSMRERLKLVDGQISIDSIPGCGTSIRASVPFSAKAKSAVSTG